jgi:hypothetical protein
MATFKADGTVASLTPTVTHLFATLAPRLASEPPLEAVSQLKSQNLGIDPIERCLIFCPDALGAHVWHLCDHHIQTIAEHANLRIPLASVNPPKTPVCFASMFTGAQPQDHGIRKYERPVLSCETLFDVLLSVHKKVAIVAVADSSVDLIFRNRRIDYFSEPYDREVTDRAVTVIRDNHHDLVIVYQQEYDDLLHATDPFSDACIQAVSNHIASFTTVAKTASEAWRGHNYAIIFAPDHGAHLDPGSGHGDHGEDIPEDMQLFHWYGVHAKRADAA